MKTCLFGLFVGTVMTSNNGIYREHMEYFCILVAEDKIQQEHRCTCTWKRRVLRRFLYLQCSYFLREITNGIILSSSSWFGSNC